MRVHRVLPAALWLPFSLTVVAAANAQTYSAGYETQDWHHSELERFHGGHLRVGLESGFEIGLDLGEARWRGGDPCAGDPAPPGCQTKERMRYGSEALSLWVGFDALSLDVPGGALIVAPGGGWSVARYWREGRGDLSEISDDHALLELGLLLGYRAPRVLGSRTGFFAEYRRHVGVVGLSPECGDCVNPIRGRIDRRALVLGVSLGG